MASTATKRIWYAKDLCEKSGDFPELFILIAEKEVNPVTVEAWAAFDQVLRLTSYDAQSVGTQNCRPITGGSGYSLHAYGIACDIDPFSLGNPYYGKTHPKAWRFSWDETEFSKRQVDAVLAIRTTTGKRVFLWGGYWTSIKDYMHWEIDVPPKDLDPTQGGGIDWSTVVGGEVPVITKGDQLLPITKDSSKENIRMLQNRLNTAFNAGLEEDGIYGSNTVQAVATHTGHTTGNTSWAEGNGVGQRQWDYLCVEFYKAQLTFESGMTQDDADVRYVRRNVQETATFK